MKNCTLIMVILGLSIQSVNGMNRDLQYRQLAEQKRIQDQLAYDTAAKRDLDIARTQKKAITNSHFYASAHLRVQIDIHNNNIRNKR